MNKFQITWTGMMSLMLMIKGTMNHHDRVEVVDGSMRGDSVNQQPEVRSMRTKRPNSKYDPAVYGLDSLFFFLQ